MSHKIRLNRRIHKILVILFDRIKSLSVAKYHRQNNAAQPIRDGRNKNVSSKSISTNKTTSTSSDIEDRGSRRLVRILVFVCKSRSALTETHWRRETDLTLDFARLSSVLSVDEFPNDNFIREVRIRFKKREIGTEGER